MSRGHLRIYLGAAPGVGKTFAMLDEGWRRHDRGTDVVVGFVETHGRPKTAAQLRDLEIVPRRVMTHRGATFEELDIDAVLARRPEVVLIDEMAHTNVPGSRHAKRYEDIDEAARRRHRRDHDRQHPAPRVGQRRGRADHRGQAARDGARRGGAGRRPGRAGRHDARGAASAHGPRQHLRGRQGRRRPGQLLPDRQPVGPARAGAAVGGRQGRRRPAGLHGGPGHRGPVGDPRARGGGRHRLAQRRGPHPPRRPDGAAGQGRSARRARPGQRRAGGRALRAARGASAAAGGPGGRVPRGHRRRGGPGADPVRPGRERHPAGARRHPTLALGRADPRLGHQRRVTRGQRHRRARHQPGPLGRR